MHRDGLIVLPTPRNGNGNGRTKITLNARSQWQAELNGSVRSYPFELVVVDNGEEGAQQDAAPFAQITTPTAGSVVSGNVLIGGLAFSGLLQQVQIEVGVGLQPESWETIRRDNLPSLNGTLGFWDSTAVDDGIYTIRLVVRDQQLGTTVASVVVSVKNSD